MASGSIKHDVTSNGDTLRFGLDSVKGEIVGSHPFESLHENVMRSLSFSLSLSVLDNL